MHRFLQPRDRLHGLIADIRKLESAQAEGNLPALEGPPPKEKEGLVWSLVEGKGWATSK